jgi:rare lipoprotein A
MSQPLPAPVSISKIIVRFAFIASFSLIMFGCAQQAASPPPLPPPPAQTPPPPPVVAAPPKEGPARVTTASFYGPGLQGHPTSSGEIFDQHAMTAASRTLPIGSHARVTNLKTGKSVVVKINDHGPFVKGRGIDLSRDAAKKIGIDHRGVAKVAVSRVDHPSKDTAKDSEKDTAKDSAKEPANETAKNLSPPATETAKAQDQPSTTSDDSNAKTPAAEESSVVSILAATETSGAASSSP